MRKNFHRFINTILVLQLVIGTSLSFARPVHAAADVTGTATLTGTITATQVPIGFVCPDYPVYPIDLGVVTTTDQPLTATITGTPFPATPVTETPLTDTPDQTDITPTLIQSWPIIFPTPCPRPPKDTTPPTITDVQLVNQKVDSTSILGNSHYTSTNPLYLNRTVVGGSVSFGATFADNAILTNIYGGVSGDGFFKDTDWTPFPTNNGTWNPVPQGHYMAAWDTTKKLADSSALSDGPYTLFLNARDKGVQDGSTFIQNNTYKYEDVVVDNTPPTASFLEPSPADGTTVRGTILLAASFDDANGITSTGISGGTITSPVVGDHRSNMGRIVGCFTDWASVGGQKCEFDTTQFPDGPRTFTAYVKDRAGNITTVTRELIIDNTKPTLPIHLSPEDGAIRTTANQQLLDWTDSEDASVVHYRYESSNSPTLNEDGSFSAPVYQSGDLADSQIASPGTPEGVYYWHVKAIDAVGNESAWTSPWKVTVDNTAPTVPIPLTPANQTVTKSVALTQTWTSTEDSVAYEYQACAYNPGNTGDACETVVDDATVTTAAHNLAAGLPNSHFWWRARAEDGAGNWSAYGPTFELTLDSSAPTITFNAVTSPTTNKSPVITGNTVDVYLAGLDTAQYRITRTSDSVVITDWSTLPVDGSGNFSFTPSSALVAGTYQFEVRSTDKATNQSTGSVQVVVQDPPTTPQTTAAPTPSPTSAPTATPTAVVTPVALAVAPATSPAPTATPTASPSPTVLASQVTPSASPTDSGQVKGAQDTASSTSFAKYWWLLLLIPLAVIFWFLFGKRRNDEDENQM
jgi:hypothetical protein